jgi:hypothetical protein
MPQVDVHGGDATADDFLDAFGFGDLGDAAEEPHEVPAERDDSNADVASELIQIKALSESQVAVKLTLGES